MSILKTSKDSERPTLNIDNDVLSPRSPRSDINSAEMSARGLHRMLSKNNSMLGYDANQSADDGEQEAQELDRSAQRLRLKAYPSGNSSN